MKPGAWRSHHFWEGFFTALGLGLGGVMIGIVMGYVLFRT